MDEHDKRLRLQKYGATVRVDKCAIGVPEVEFNGHLLSAAGITLSHRTWKQFYDFQFQTTSVSCFVFSVLRPTI